MTDGQGFATGGLVRAEDAPLLLDGNGCTYYVWPDRMPGREALRFTLNLGAGADRIDLGRLTGWIDAGRRG